MIPVNREDRDGVTILHVQGELDFENTVWLRGEFYDLLKQNRHKVILNLSGVDMISSYTVGVFVAFARELRDRGGDLTFAQLQQRVAQTFQATRIDNILHVYERVEEAVSEFESTA